MDEHSAGALSLQVVADRAGLDALSGEWRRLLRDDPRSTPFQSPAWLLTWASHYAPDRTGAIAVREAGRLVALVPFFTWRGTLLLAGTGPSDYGDGLFAPRRTDCNGELVKALCVQAGRRGCADIDLQQLRADSPLLQGTPPPGWRDSIEAGTVCPVARLDADPAMPCVSVRWRKNIARAGRVLDAEAPSELRIAAAGEFAAAAATLRELHAARWGSGDDPLLPGFVDAVLPALHEHGQSTLHCLLARGRTLAVVWTLRCGPAAYFYRCAFDARWSRFSPGLLAIAGAMRDAASAGIVEFHFLRGQESYKYHLGAQDRPTFRRRLRRASD